MCIHYIFARPLGTIYFKLYIDGASIKSKNHPCGPSPDSTLFNHTSLSQLKTG
jgi:hypothetical protein